MLNSEVLAQDAVGMVKGLMKEELGVQKVALVMEDSNFGRDFLKILQAKLPSEAGVEVAKAINFPINNPDFNAILQQMGILTPTRSFQGLRSTPECPSSGRRMSSKPTRRSSGLLLKARRSSTGRAPAGASWAMPTPTLRPARRL
jgi:hypothetical protein